MPPPELTAAVASGLIVQKWSADEFNHFRLSLHSDTLIQCGVQNDLWKLGDITDSAGRTWGKGYHLTERGKKVIFSIDLKESGRGHEIVLRGPYQLEILGVMEGTQPANRRVKLRWQIDWDKASADLKACLPRHELSGVEVALFDLNEMDWRFVSYLKPEDAQRASSAPR